MKLLRCFFAGALMLLTIVSCDDNETSGYDDSHYASQASISSSDNLFTPTSNGGTIAFGTEGGEVVVNVDCEIDWTAISSGADWLEISANSEYRRVVVSAGQNTVEAQQTAIITLVTANEGIEFAVIDVIQEAYETMVISVGSTECNFPAIGELSAEIDVTANAEWTVQNSSAWLTTEKTDTGIRLTAEENDDTEGRDVEITLTCSDGVSSSSASIMVTQDAKVFLTISSKSLTFYGDADSSFIDVESNFDWSFDYDNTNSWFTVEKGNGALIVTVTEYDEGDEREGIINITAGDGSANVAEETITIVQYSSNALILEYTTPEDNVKVVLPFEGTIDCIIDWGDDSEADYVITSYPDHTYAKAGVYYISVTGTMTAISNSTTYPTPEYLTGLKQWGHTGLTSLYTAFYNCSNLKYLPAYTGTSLEGLTHVFGWQLMSSFQGCTALESIPEDLFADCPNCTILWNTFYQCASLKSIPEGLFDSGKFTSFQGAFQNCTGLTSIPAGLFDKCTNATSFQDTFNGCSSVAGESPYTVVNGEKVHLYERSADNGFTEPTSHSGCFSGCNNLTDVNDIPSGWK